MTTNQTLVAERDVKLLFDPLNWMAGSRRYGFGFCTFVYVARRAPTNRGTERGELN